MPHMALTNLSSMTSTVNLLSTAGIFQLSHEAGEDSTNRRQGLSVKSMNLVQSRENLALPCSTRQTAKPWNVLFRFSFQVDHDFLTRLPGAVE